MNHGYSGREVWRPEVNSTAALVVRAAAILVSAFAFTVQARQAGGVATGRVDSDQRLREMRELDEREREREFMLLMTERLRDTATPREPRLAFTQIREDFLRLQTVNNELAEATSREGALDLKLVVQSADEIRKRAGRLLDNLALPGPEKRTQSPGTDDTLGPEQLRQSLRVIDGLILRFAKNLASRGVNHLNAEYSGRARLDLEAIITLSGRVKRSGERLSRTTRKAQ